MKALAYNSSAVEMSEAQRVCMLHVLRNMTTAFTGTISLLEQTGKSPTAEDLFGCLIGAQITLDRVLNALETGNFCTLTKEQCEFAGKHMGCKISS